MRAQINGSVFYNSIKGRNPIEGRISVTPGGIRGFRDDISGGFTG
jgi:hypothetical protein